MNFLPWPIPSRFRKNVLRFSDKNLRQNNDSKRMIAGLPTKVCLAFLQIHIIGKNRGRLVQQDVLRILTGIFNGDIGVQAALI
jgi:hypothetical protein